MQNKNDHDQLASIDLGQLSNVTGGKGGGGGGGPWWAKPLKWAAQAAAPKLISWAAHDNGKMPQAIRNAWMGGTAKTLGGKLGYLARRG